MVPVYSSKTLSSFDVYGEMTWYTCNSHSRVGTTEGQLHVTDTSLSFALAMQHVIVLSFECDMHRCSLRPRIQARKMSSSAMLSMQCKLQPAGLHPARDGTAGEAMTSSNSSGFVLQQVTCYA